MKKVILASQSPRRREILSDFGAKFDVIPARGEETFDPDLDIDEALKKVARKKAEEVAASHPDAAVLSADTIVYHDGKILGKPKGEQEAFEMIKSLSGKPHEVKTGVALIHDGKEEAVVSTTLVYFRPLSDEEIWNYVHKKTCLDKAGSYGIQETDFTDHLEGSYTNVVGLPVEVLEDWKSILIPE